MKHWRAPGRPRVSDLQGECGQSTTERGFSLFCGLREGHGGWHQMCRPGTRDPEFFLVTGNVHVVGGAQ